MITADTFTKFARRMASTQRWPYVVIVDTPNPIREIEFDVLRTRAEAMIAAVIDGLTLPPAEIERRLKVVAKQQIHPEGVVRSSVPV